MNTNKIICSFCDQDITRDVGNFNFETNQMQYNCNCGNIALVIMSDVKIEAETI